MDALNLTLPIATVLSMLVGTIAVTWKISKHSLLVNALHERIDKMEKEGSAFPMMEEHEKKLNSHDDDIKDIKMMIQKDRVDMADWRARSETNQVVMKNALQEMKEGLNRISDMFSEFLKRREA